MDGGLYAYLLRHTREPPVLAALRADTAERYPSAAHMAVSPDQGAFLAWLAHTLGARRVIEVGVFTGYSSVALALALPPGGRLVACERDPKALAVARQYWQRAGVAHKVGVVTGWWLAGGWRLAGAGHRRLAGLPCLPPKSAAGCGPESRPCLPACLPACLTR